MADDPDRLPPWVTWQQRPFPDANLLLLPGRNPALVDSGFAGHAGQTADWVHARTGQLPLVVNTHWHADHVGGNAMLQARGPGSPPASRTPTRSPAATLAAARPNTSTSPSPPTPSTSSSTMARSCRSVTPSGRSSALPGTLRATCACGSPTSGSSSPAMPCPTTTSAGSTPHSTDPMPPRPHSLLRLRSPHACCSRRTDRSSPTRRPRWSAHKLTTSDIVGVRGRQPGDRPVSPGVSPRCHG